MFFINSTKRALLPLLAPVFKKAAGAIAPAALTMT